MDSETPVAPEDQEFLALLVHRGFLQREDALAILQAAREQGFEAALEARTGWDASRVAYLRRTRGLSEPEIPGYEMLGRLGAGGTSEVFGARRRKDFRKVALKILLPRLALDPPAVRRFLEEAKILQRLRHPNIVRGHRVFRFLGTYVLEMDLVPGRPLDQVLEEDGPLDEESALGVVRQVARALEALREAGLVHRDLKPGNLMMDAQGKVVLIDLGFAGPGRDLEALEGTTLGTTAYIAPEQARGEEGLDVRADIYSLGATLYHLVVGRLPFERSSDAEMMRAQILERLDGAALKEAPISPSVHYFIQKMMAKDRELRYASPAALAEEIEAHEEARRRLG